ncbi:MAG: hypothetical protein LBB14_01730 [Puniceicoccales bacterium]|jgi:hypothetical protein|nr:hypothetical protein [Puniceicoccales bacterium]
MAMEAIQEAFFKLYAGSAHVAREILTRENSTPADLAGKTQAKESSKLNVAQWVGVITSSILTIGVVPVLFWILFESGPKRMVTILAEAGTFREGLDIIKTEFAGTTNPLAQMAAETFYDEWLHSELFRLLDQHGLKDSLAAALDSIGFTCGQRSAGAAVEIDYNGYKIRDVYSAIIAFKLSESEGVYVPTASYRGGRGFVSANSLMLCKNEHPRPGEPNVDSYYSEYGRHMMFFLAELLGKKWPSESPYYVGGIARTPDSPELKFDKENERQYEIKLSIAFSVFVNLEIIASKAVGWMWTNRACFQREMGHPVAILDSSQKKALFGGRDPNEMTAEELQKTADDALATFKSRLEEFKDYPKELFLDATSDLERVKLGFSMPPFLGVQLLDNCSKDSHAYEDYCKELSPEKFKSIAPRRFAAQASQ